MEILANLRNVVGIVFAPTLNIPATLISLFVTQHHEIFGPPIDIANVTLPLRNSSDLPADAVRSPRRQTFSDLPTPAYTQANFTDQQYQQGLSERSTYDTGFVAKQPPYPRTLNQGDNSFASLNGALAPPVREGPKIVDMRGNGLTSRQAKRESSAFFMNNVFGEGELQRLQDNEGMGGKF